ncbi:Aldo/keto reductase [Hymenopellis radicata]|nr:Aldo/keto reductase [Hymenopellis radicata]
MSTIELKRTGQKMPLVGFGLWKVTKSSCADTVYNAIKEGYRLLDGAGDYGNEKEAGEGVKRAIDDGLVKREDLFITSKLWNTFHAKEHVEQLSRKQLALWGIDYFDLFLIHFPVSLEYVDPAHRYPPEWWGDDKKVHLSNVSIQETWTALEKLVDEGLAKNIGISNFQAQTILDILRYARYEPQVLQIELHPYLSQEALVNFSKTHNIAVTALLAHDAVTQAATAHQKAPAQVLLRWATQRGIAVIPKSNTHERLAENLQSTDFTLTDAEIKAINGLNINLRLNDPAEIDPRIAIFA